MSREGQPCEWYITPDEAERGIKLPPGMHIEGGRNTCPRNLPAEQANTARPDGRSACPHADPELCNSAYFEECRCPKRRGAAQKGIRKKFRSPY